MMYRPLSGLLWAETSAGVKDWDILGVGRLSFFGVCVCVSLVGRVCRRELAEVVDREIRWMRREKDGESTDLGYFLPRSVRGFGCAVIG